MTKNHYFFIGLALFSMFFGSGNLIYPLFVGQLAQSQSLLASFGFFLTGVIVPFLGVITMIIYKGDYARFFSCLGKSLGPLFAFFLLTIWAPLGCCPRCTTLSFASFNSIFPRCPLWLFSLIYSVLVYFVIEKKGRMLTILGYILTPILLVCLGMIIFQGGSLSTAFASPTFEGLPHFYNGLVEGYNTIDLIAAFFISASIIQLLKQDSKHVYTTVFKACFVAAFLLGLIYFCLIGMAGVHYNLLEGVPKDQMLTYLSKVLLGPQIGLVSIVAIFLACLTTSIAQIVVYAEFLQKKIPSPFFSKVLALGITYVMSLTGLEGAPI